MPPIHQKIGVVFNIGDMKYDLILVGTGFASSFFLKKYLESAHAGKKVLVIERGRLYPSIDRIKFMQGNAPAYYPQLESNIDSVQNTNPKKPWVFDLNHGGSSNCWWGCTPRLMPSDFKLKSLYGIGTDWPIDYNDLEPFYTEAEAILGISGPDDTPFLKSKPYPLPAHAFSTVDDKMKAAYPNLWTAQPTARASLASLNRNKCCSSYTCNICPANAKFTIEQCLNSVFEDPRVELKYHLQAIQIEFKNNIASKLVCVSTNDKDKQPPISFEGDIIALGANAIFNAHLLLNSGDTNAFTGRGLSEQRGFFADVHLGFDNVGGGTSITANGYMEYDGNFRSQSASCLIENHNAPVIRNERGKWRKIARLKFVLETLPDLKNYVGKGDDLYKPKIVFNENAAYADNGRKRIEKNIHQILAPLQPEQILFEQKYVESECHLLSSVRMGYSANDSTVDDTLLHHQYRNLFVLGGSAFPTISASNPTLTLSALSLRAAANHFK